LSAWLFSRCVVAACCCCCCCLLLLYDCAHIEAQLICSGVLFKSDPRPVSQLQAFTVGHHVEPEKRNCGDCLKLMQSMVWCVTYKLVAAVLERVVKGARFGCHHCQGVIVHCYSIGAGCCGDEAPSLALARASAAKGSSCGHCVLGHW